MRRMYVNEISILNITSTFINQYISKVTEKWPKDIVKGALDKSNIYPFISNSIEDIKSSKYQNFESAPYMKSVSMP